MASRKLQEINAGSMADIAFLLLIFYLVTTTMDTDSGLMRRLPPLPEIDAPEPPPINERNVFIVLLNSKDQLLVEGAPMDVSELRDAAKEFIMNPANKEELPKKDVKYFELLDKSYNYCPQAIISLQNDNGTTYSVYLDVQNELIAAYREVRDEFARSEFGKPYMELDADTQKGIRNVIKQVISESEPQNLGN